MRRLWLIGWVCMLLPILVFSQNTIITGKIKDSKGSPIPYATIAIKKGLVGVGSDGEGNFRIQVPPNAILVISAAGYKSEEIAAGSGELTIVLKEDVARLDEVVVTGLSTTVKRRNLANAVVSISSRQLSGIAPAQTLDASMEGKIPGAYINANSGAPGGGISVKLRGVTSVYGNTQPLYVVDGVFVDNSSTSSGFNAVTFAAPTGGATSTQDNPSSRIADLRPEDIENIEILKGASAAAIYGSKAAAGVIIITTKKGRGGRTTVTASQDLGFVKVRKLLGVRTFTADRAASLSSDPTRSAALRQQFLDAQSAGHIYDYEKEIYGNKGFLRNTAVSLSGGNERTGVYLSAAQKDEGGIVKNTGYRNSSLRLNVDHRLNDNVKVGGTATYINTSSNRGFFGNDNAGISTGIALSSTPSFAQLHPDAQGNYPVNTFGAANPLQTIAQMENNESVNRAIIGGNLEVILQKSRASTTRLVARGGLDFYDLDTKLLFPGTLQFQTINKGTSIKGNTYNLNTNYIVSAVNAWNASDRLSFTTSAGLTVETGDYSNVLNIATLLIAGQSNVDQAGSLSASELRMKYQNQGLFLQEEVGISDALTLTGGIRLDRSSNNGDAGKYYAYPKAGLSWNLTRMGFPDNGIFDNLKLRAAYGQANNVPAYGSKFTSLVGANIGGYPGVLIGTQAGQANIKPERQSEFEAGIDFSLLKGRLGFELTYYHKNIDDFLMQSSLPASSGFTTKWVNAGDLRNQGIELGMNARPVETKAVTWNSSVNFWFNRSKVTKLTIPSVPQGSFGYVLGSFQVQEGKSATQIIGLDGANGPAVIGDAEPRFQMNTYNEVTFFKHLSLRFLLHWKKGGDNINLTNLESDFGGTSADYDAVTNKANLPDGVYRLTQIGSTARLFVQDASYLRLREIGLYYSFTDLPVRYVKGLRLGVSLNNWLTATKYKSYDPEVSNFGTGFSTGVDVTPYPATKRAIFHISLDF